ncbi:MAG: hypothetical protein M3Q10_14025, partial [Chloroflexota bacterium]|nr:hypothetical protein [Chloroflexota bacterium]
MARRNRMLRVLGILALLLAVLAPLVPSVPAVAQQETPERGNRNRDRNQNQNQNRQPVEDEAPAEAGERTSRFPLEVEVEGALFSFDRSVPIDPATLTEVEQQRELIILAESAAGPFDRVFVSAPPRPENLGRYLPQTPADGTCLAEALPTPNVDTGQATYAFAGLEGDVTPDDLAPAFQTEAGETVYAEEGQTPPRELLAETANGLERYVLLGEDGRPSTLRDALGFNGQRFDFGGDVSGQVDPAALTPVGCTGPFRIAAETAEGPFDQIYAVVGQSVFSYAAQDDGAGGTTDASPAADEADQAPEDPVITPPDGTAAPEETAVLDETPVLDETAVLTETAPAGVEEPEETVEVAATEEPAATPDATAAEATGTDPGAFPPEVQVDDARFFRDRVVPVDVAALAPVGEAAGVPLYAAEDVGPFERVYGVTDGDTGEAARYLAEQPLGDDGTPSAEALCLAEQANFFPLALGEIRYAVAGAEPDLTAADLQEIAQTAAGEPIYAETTESPAPELFFEADGQLFRFVLVGDDGPPGNLDPNITFGGQTFAFEGDVTGQVDPNGLARIGCAGPYSAQSEQGEEVGALSRLYVVLSDQTPQVLAFAATGGAAPTTPAEPATPTAEAPATT